MATSSRTLRGAALLAAALLAACDGGGGPSQPVPGELLVRLETPFTSDRAVVVAISGPGPVGAVTAARAGDLVYARPGGAPVKAAVFGQLATGDLLRFSVPDVRQAGAYTATVVEVADNQNRPRESLDVYRLTISR